MFDFSWADHTLANVLFCVFVYALFVALYFKRYVKNALPQESRTNKKLLFFALFLIITTCIDGDWFNYREMVYDYDFSQYASNHGEPIYGFIISLVNKNYFLFRLLVWGGAFVLTKFAFKRFDVNLNVAFFFLIAVFLVKFNYSRSTLGMASCCIGISYLLKPKKSLLISFLLAALFFWGAYEFHHSVLILVLLSIVTIYLPVDKPVVLVVLLAAMPFLAAVLKDNLILVDQIIENEYLTDKLESYLARSTGPSNLLGMIGSIIGYGVFAIPILYDTIVVTHNRTQIPVLMIRLYRVIISTSVLAVSFSFMGLESSVFVYRILFMTFLPLTILTVYLFEHKLLSQKWYTYSALWGIFAISFKLLQLVWEYR